MIAADDSSRRRGVCLLELGILNEIRNQISLIMSRFEPKQKPKIFIRHYHHHHFPLPYPSIASIVQCEQVVEFHTYWLSFFISRL